MKHLSRILMPLLVLVATVQFLAAQCSPAPGTGGTTFPYGVTDSITPMLFRPQPFIACDNALLYYDGNNPDTIYLETSTRLVVGSCFNLVVYMRSNSQLRIDLISTGMRQFQEIIYDTSYTTFVDTAGMTVVNGLTACPGLTYSFAAFPNGTSPCITTGVSPASNDTPILKVWPQPATDGLHLSLPRRATGATVGLFALDGRQVLRETLSGSELRLPVADLPGGLYLLRVSDARQSWVRRVVIN